MSHLAIGRHRNYVGIVFEQLQPKQPIVVDRAGRLSDTQPFQIGVEFRHGKFRSEGSEEQRAIDKKINRSSYFHCKEGPKVVKTDLPQSEPKQTIIPEKNRVQKTEFEFTRVRG
jgi:hypothetical protein